MEIEKRIIELLELHGIDCLHILDIKKIGKTYYYECKFCKIKGEYKSWE